MHSGRSSEPRFDVLIRKVGDVYFLYSKEWHLLVQGTDLNQAYEKIKGEQELILERYRKAGLEHELPRFSSKEPIRAFGVNVGLNVLAGLTKSIVVGIVLCVFVFLVSFNQIQLLVHKVDDMTSPSPILLGKIADGMADKIARAMVEISPERRDNLKRNFQTIAREMRAFTSELEPIPSNGFKQ